MGKLPVSGRPTIWMAVGEAPAALAVGAGGCCLGIFTTSFLRSVSLPCLHPFWTWPDVD